MNGFEANVSFLLLFEPLKYEASDAPKIRDATVSLFRELISLCFSSASRWRNSANVYLASIVFSAYRVLNVIVNYYAHF